MMASTKLPTALWVVATLSVAQRCVAGEVATFDSCTDVAGRTIAAEIDYAQTTLVRTSLATRQPAIRYNPALLPGLTPLARQFFYAHECARHAVGDAGKADLSLARVRQADCVALATLLASGLLTRDQVAALQSDLNFTAIEWEALPGPPRGFDLAACRTGGVLRLPAASSPSPRQTEWNAAMRACADRLWTCQKGCRGEACVSDCVASHRQCEAHLGDAPRNPP
jgi:hypothetical protein